MKIQIQKLRKQQLLSKAYINANKEVKKKLQSSSQLQNNMLQPILIDFKPQYTIQPQFHDINCFFHVKKCLILYGMIIDPRLEQGQDALPEVFYSHKLQISLRFQYDNTYNEIKKLIQIHASFGSSYLQNYTQVLLFEDHNIIQIIAQPFRFRWADLQKVIKQKKVRAKCLTKLNAVFSIKNLLEGYKTILFLAKKYQNQQIGFKYQITPENIVIGQDFQLKMAYPGITRKPNDGKYFRKKKNIIYTDFRNQLISFVIEHIEPYIDYQDKNRIVEIIFGADYQELSNMESQIDVKAQYDKVCNSYLKQLNQIYKKEKKFPEVNQQFQSKYTELEYSRFDKDLIEKYNHIERQISQIDFPAIQFIKKVQQSRLQLLKEEFKSQQLHVSQRTNNQIREQDRIENSQNIDTTVSRINIPM